MGYQYIFRKPKTYDHLVDMFKQTNTTGKLVDIVSDKNDLSETWFNGIKPMVLIYNKNKFIALAYFYHDQLIIMDINEEPIINKFTKSEIGEIKINIKQMELF